MNRDFAKTFHSNRYGQILVTRDCYVIGAKSSDAGQRKLIIEVYYRHDGVMSRLAVEPSRQSLDAVDELFNNISRKQLESYIDSQFEKQPWTDSRDNVRFHNF